MKTKVISVVTGPPGKRRVVRRTVISANSQRPPAHPPWPANHELTWISLAQLQVDTLTLASLLPRDIDGIAGVPRSGLLPAAAIATLLHLPLYAATSRGIMAVGSLGRLRNCKPATRIVAVDDSICTGGAMRRARVDPRIVYSAAVYSTGEATADVFARRLSLPHIFEWNFFNQPDVGFAAFDMDGILCHDPLEYVDDDPAKAAAWFAVAKPKYLVRSQPIPHIITGRLEQHRAVTEQWLASYGVAVERLTMSPHLDHQHRNRSVARWKGEQFAASPTQIMIESDAAQAEIIHAVSGKPVLCPSLGRILTASTPALGEPTP